VDPEPVGRSEVYGPENNLLTRLWFGELTDSLVIRVRSEVDTVCGNPFAFLPDASEPLPDALDSALFRLSMDEEDRVASWAAERQREADDGLVPFLMHLNAHMADSFDVTFREHGPPRDPRETLERRDGACRDLAVLFIDACRSLGLPARFVSGYAREESVHGERHLHAWPEVYVPGGGWRGFDPTNGLAVADAHVALCASADPKLTTPIQGSFRGAGVESSMEVRIDINVS
jgi:transglutaminase-like putative cysteine protease